MAEITTTAFQTFKNGVADSSQVVGYITSPAASYVTRYTFSTAGLATGGSSISFAVPKGSADYWGLYGGSAIKFRFKVTTSDTSHIGAGPATTDYDGEVVLTKADSSTYYISIPETNVLLLPNTTYYLYIFPAEAKSGWFNNRADKLTLIISGSAGIVYISTGVKLEPYQGFVYTGSKWEQHLPYVYTRPTWELH